MTCDFLKARMLTILKLVAIYTITPIWTLQKNQSELKTISYYLELEHLY